MMQVVEMTREEKIAMYMKLSKRELTELLLNSETIINGFAQPPIQIQPGTWEPQPYPRWEVMPDYLPTYTTKSST